MGTLGHRHGYTRSSMMLIISYYLILGPSPWPTFKRAKNQHINKPNAHVQVNPRPPFISIHIESITKYITYYYYYHCYLVVVPVSQKIAEAIDRGWLVGGKHRETRL